MALVGAPHPSQYHRIETVCETHSSIAPALRAIKDFPNTSSPELSGRLKPILSSFSTEILDLFIAEFTTLKIENGDTDVVSYCLSLMSAHQIDALFQRRSGSSDLDNEMKTEALRIAQNFAKKEVQWGKVISDVLLNESSSGLNVVKNFIQSFIMTFLASNDFSNPDKPVTDRLQAQWHLRTFYEVMAVPLSTAATLYTLVKGASEKHLSTSIVVPYLIMIGIALLAYMSLRFYQRYINAAPQRLSHDFPNMTEEAKQGKFDAIVGRQAEIQRMVACLGRLDQQTLHPLLIGQSGCGKSALVEELAKQIAKGEHPNLAGKTVFRINTSMLKESGSYDRSGYSSRLESLLLEIKGKEDQIILFFDEAHTFLQESASDRSSGKGQLGQKIKTYLDNNHIFCIAATTQKEYEATIATDPAFKRRFCIIQVSELGENDSIAAIADTVGRAYPHIPIEPGAIQHAITLTNNDDKDEIAQPSKGKALVMEAAQMISQYRGREVDELVSTKDEIQHLLQEIRRTSSFVFSEQTHTEKMKRLSQLNEKRDALINRISQINDQIKQMQSCVTMQQKWKQRYINLAHEIVASNSVELRRKMGFISIYILSTFDQRLSYHTTALEAQGVKLRIDKNLIETVHNQQHPSAL